MWQLSKFLVWTAHERFRAHTPILSVFFFRSFALFVISVCGPQTYSFSNASTVAEFTMVGWIDKTRRMGVGHPHISSRPSTHGRGKPLPTTDPGHHRQRAGRRRYRADTEQGQAGDTSSDVPVETSQSPDSRPLAHLFLFQLTNHPRIQAPRDFPGHKSDSFCQLLDCPQKIAQFRVWDLFTIPAITPTLQWLFCTFQ